MFGRLCATRSRFVFRWRETEIGEKRDTLDLSALPTFKRTASDELPKSELPARTERAHFGEYGFIAGNAMHLPHLQRPAHPRSGLLQFVVEMNVWEFVGAGIVVAVVVVGLIVFAVLWIADKIMRGTD